MTREEFMAYIDPAWTAAGAHGWHLVTVKRNSENRWEATFKKGERRMTIDQDDAEREP